MAKMASPVVKVTVPMLVTGSKRPPQCGFTLLEMLAVLVMLALVAALLSIPMRHTFKRMGEARTVNAVTSILRRAHLRALSSGTVQTVKFDFEHRRFTLNGGHSHHWPEEMKLTLTTAREAGNAYLFFPDGASSGGHLELDGSAHWQVNIAWLTGAVQMRRMR